MEEEYKITLIGPDGYVDFTENSHEDAITTAGNLLSASNGYHMIEIEQKHVE